MIHPPQMKQYEMSEHYPAAGLCADGRGALPGRGGGVGAGGGEQESSSKTTLPQVVAVVRALHFVCVVELVLLCAGVYVVKKCL
jgi:hypothetical protein